MKPLLALLLALAVACTQTPPPPVTPPPDPATIVRISVTPGAAMLTKAGETRVVSAKAFNATGAEVAASFTWTSSKPSAVSVDANGKLTAVTEVGSSQITASSGGMQSPPVLVTVVTPASGAVLIADEQVVSSPTPVNPDAEPDLTNEYEVVLRNLEPPAVGTILLGTGAAPIGGKVVSSVAVAGGVRVRLKLATVKEMVAKASFDEVMSFRGAPLNLPKAISDAYNVAQVGDEYTLTPKPAATARVRAQGGPQGTSVFTALPFNECTTNTPALPITLSALPTMTIKIDPTYELKTDEFGALERLVFKATPSLKATIPFIINADATISLECTSTLYSKLIPLPGWLGLILAGELEAGIGFELTGKVTLFNAGVELTSETTATVEMGMECAFGECNMVRKLETVRNENKVSWKIPNLGQFRIEPSLFGFGYVKAKLGATLLKSLRVEALGAKAGVKYEASLAPVFVQVQPTPAPDPDYKSSYKLAALLEISAGKKISNLLTNLGIVKFNALKFSSSFPLGQSPSATALSMDAERFKPGDTVNFSASLKTDTVNFPGVGYNVTRVVIYRDRLGTVEAVASQTAAPGQTDFSIPWVANIGSIGGGNSFFAFVETVLPSVVDLELGAFVPPAPPPPPIPENAWGGNLTLEYDFTVAWNETIDNKIDFFDPIRCGFLSSFAQCTLTQSGSYTGTLRLETSADSGGVVRLETTTDVLIGSSGSVTGSLSGTFNSATSGSDGACQKSGSGVSTSTATASSASGSLWRLNVSSLGAFQLGMNTLSAGYVGSQSGQGQSSQTAACSGGARNDSSTTPITPFNPPLVKLMLGVFKGSVDAAGNVWGGNDTLSFTGTNGLCESLIIDTPAKQGITCSATLKGTWNLNRRP